MIFKTIGLYVDLFFRNVRDSWFIHLVVSVSSWGARACMFLEVFCFFYALFRVLCFIVCDLGVLFFIHVLYI